MTDRNATPPSKSRNNGAVTPARRISFAALDLAALERDLDALPKRSEVAIEGDAARSAAPGSPAARPTPARPRASNKARASRGKAEKPEAVETTVEPPVCADAVLATDSVSAAASPAPSEETPDPFEVVARHSRLLLRLSAATEGLEARYRELAEQRRGDDALLEEAREEVRQTRQQARRLALESVRLMDALDWVYEALSHRADPLAAQVASARRDCLRHLAAVGITEIPAEGRMDGRLHEGLESVATGEIPQYHIISVVRRGYQMGTDVLRRTEVTTAE